MNKHLILLLMLVILIASMPAIAFSQEAIVVNSGKIPLAFTANEGQINSQVKFTAAGNGAQMFFTSGGTIIILSREIEGSVARRAQRGLAKQGGESEYSAPSNHLAERKPEKEMEHYGMKVNFIGANQNPEATGEDRLLWNNNYFIGNDPSRWRTDVPNYVKIRLKNLYNGIDLVYYGNNNRIKYDFVLQPGAHADQVLLSYELGEGVAQGGSLSINQSGQLIIKTPFGELIEEKPYAYQEIDGRRIDITVEYRIVSEEKNQFTFSLSGYNNRFPVIIDPELIYSTFIGGSGFDEGYKISLDGSGNTYITGTTYSSSFPVTAGVYDDSQDGNWDVFVSKLNAAGSSLLYSTFLGGTSVDQGYGIAVDESGNAYVTGHTYSASFPVTPGACDESHNGYSDIFLSKLNATGNSLLYSTFLGGNHYDWGYGLVLDGSGNAHITGWTSSPSFPVTPGAYDESHNGGNDVFVSKLNSTGSSLIYSTFLGTSGGENGEAIARDESGNVYITGSASSSFPVTSGAFDESHNGGMDVFVSKLNATGSALLYSTLIGGSNDDAGRGIALDRSGNMLLTGATYSSSFPFTPGAYDEKHNGGWDIFVSKLNATGNSLLYSTFLGGGNSDEGKAIAMDGNGNAYVTGFTYSSSFPVTPGAFDESHNGYSDVFMSTLNAMGNSLLYSTFLGGNSYDCAAGIVLDGSGNVHIAGTTYSRWFPVTPDAYDKSYNGGSDAFMAKFRFEADVIPPTITISISPEYLWPPNHTMVQITTSLAVIDNCDPSPNVKLYSIKCNEPANGNGDGNTDIDIQGADIGIYDKTFFLRAERSGKADFRSYEIIYCATDSSGNTGFDTTCVLVVHDKGIRSLNKSAIAIIPYEYNLSQNYPNPFNPETEIGYQLPEASHVTLTIYNLMGQKIRMLVNTTMSSGYHYVKWDGTNDLGRKVASGIYLYRMHAGRFTDVKKMVMLE